MKKIYVLFIALLFSKSPVQAMDEGAALESAVSDTTNTKQNAGPTEEQETTESDKFPNEDSVSANDRTENQSQTPQNSRSGSSELAGNNEINPAQGQNGATTDVSDDGPNASTDERAASQVADDAFTKTQWDIHDHYNRPLDGTPDINFLSQPDLEGKLTNEQKEELKKYQNDWKAYRDQQRAAQAKKTLEIDWSNTGGESDVDADDELSNKDDVEESSNIKDPLARLGYNPDEVIDLSGNGTLTQRQPAEPKSQDNALLNAKMQDLSDQLDSLLNQTDKLDDGATRLGTRVPNKGEEVNTKKFLQELSQAKKELAKLEDQSLYASFDSTERSKIIVLKDKVVEVQKKLRSLPEDAKRSVKDRASQLETKVNDLTNQVNTASTTAKIQDIAQEVKNAQLELQSIHAKVIRDQYRTGRDWNIKRDEFGQIIPRGQDREIKTKSRLRSLTETQTKLNELEKTLNEKLKEQGITNEALLSAEPQGSRTNVPSDEDTKTLTASTYVKLRSKIDERIEEIQGMQSDISKNTEPSMPETSYKRLVRRVEKQLDNLAEYRNAKTKDGAESTNAKKLEKAEYELEDKLQELQEQFNARKPNETRTSSQELTRRRKQRLSNTISNEYVGDLTYRGQRRAQTNLDSLQAEVNRYPDQVTTKKGLLRRTTQVDNTGAKRELSDAITDKRNNIKQQGADINNNRYTGTVLESNVEDSGDASDTTSLASDTSGETPPSRTIQLLDTTDDDSSTDDDDEDGDDEDSDDEM